VKEGEKMQYLVDMKLAAYGRPTGGPQDGISFIEQFILPSLELCQKLEVEKKILAGGPANGAIRLVMIVSAESAQELDELIESLPIWPQMETTVTPLTSFNGRMIALRPRLERLKAKLQDGPAAAI
jgi:muconolactone delta-isomerase